MINYEENLEAEIILYSIDKPNSIILNFLASEVDVEEMKNYLQKQTSPSYRNFENDFKETISNLMAQKILVKDSPSYLGVSLFSVERFNPGNLEYLGYPLIEDFPEEIPDKLFLNKEKLKERIAGGYVPPIIKEIYVETKNDDVPDYNISENFNNSLDDEKVNIANSDFNKSWLLYNTDPELYAIALEEFNENEKDTFFEQIPEEAPQILANPLHHYRHDYDSEQNRLHLLRDVWENAIHLLYSIALCELRFRNIKLPLLKKSKDLFSDRIDHKCYILKKILDLADKQKIELDILDIYTSEDIDALIDLNNERNGFLHSQAISEKEAKEKHQKLYPILKDILCSLAGLLEIKIGSYKNANSPPTKISFSGHNGTSPKNFDFDFGENFPNVMAELNDLEAVCIINDNCFRLSPFIKIKEGDGSRVKNMAILKQKKGGKLIYEAITETSKFPIDPDYCDDQIKLMQTLFKDDSPKILK